MTGCEEAPPAGFLAHVSWCQPSHPPAPRRGRRPQRRWRCLDLLHGLGCGLLAPCIPAPGLRPTCFLWGGTLQVEIDDDGDQMGGLALYKKSLELQPDFWRSAQNIGYYHVNMAKKYLSMAAGQMPTMMLKNSKVEELLGTMNKWNFEQPKIA